MLKPRKIAYYYDEQACNYTKARFTPRWFAETFLTYGVFAIFAVWGFSAYYRANFSTTKGTALLAENQKLIASLEEVNSQLDGFESLLDELLDRQNTVYSTIVGSGTISPSIWEGGAGGSARFGLSDKRTLTGIRINKLRHRIGLLQKGLKDARFKAELKDEFLANMPSIMPVNGKLISGFGFRSLSIHGGGHMHTGLDFACKIGTPIYASGDGVVLTTGTPESGYGLQIDLNHGNGYVTKYAHLSKIAVSPGQEIDRGQLIGYSGNTGFSTGPHLHYEIIHNGVKIDPMDYFYSDLSPTTYLKKKLDAPAMDAHQEGEGN
jgi:murein DD-endopeptidase MepM/ murein hydrolase activator NlpD